jgi:hypothetical protein
MKAINKLWLPFEDQGPQCILYNNPGRSPVFRVSCGRVSVASYKYDEDYLQVWRDKICDPSVPVMFLIQNLSVHSRRIVVPRHIVTDGDKWCPLVYGDDTKFYSYPTCYTGALLTVRDQDLIIKTLQSYVRHLEEEG